MILVHVVVGRSIKDVVGGRKISLKTASGGYYTASQAYFND